jgi:hypothetical protein
MSTPLSTRFSNLCLLFVVSVLVACGGPSPKRPPPKQAPRYPAADLNAAPKPYFWQQMRQFSTSPAACFSALDAVPAITFAKMNNTAPSTGCGLRNAVKLQTSLIALNKPIDISCPMSAALHVWMRDVVVPSARLHLDAKIIRIETIGTYACRPRNNQAGGRLSEHATANAIDISAFVLSDKRRITVLNGWRGAPADAAFLRSVRKQSCPYFSVVLGPDDDRFHVDHFHFDMGPWRQCR